MKKQTFLFFFIGLLVIFGTILFLTDREEIIKEIISSEEKEFIFFPVGINNSNNISYEWVDNETLHFWNDVDDYYLNMTSGIQITNHKDNFWTKNIWCLAYKTTFWNYKCADTLNINLTAESDNLTYVTISGERNITIGGKTIEFGLIYNLSLEDKEVKITTSITHVSGSAITNELAFAWRIEDIKINGDTRRDKLFINNTWYDLKGEINLLFSNMTKEVFYNNNTINETCFFELGLEDCVLVYDNYTEIVNIPFYKIQDKAFISLRWNPNVSYFVQVKNKTNQVNAPVTVALKTMGLNVGQTKSTNFFWRDPIGGMVIGTNTASIINITALGSYTVVHKTGDYNNEAFDEAYDLTSQGSSSNNLISGRIIPLYAPGDSNMFSTTSASGMDQGMTLTVEGTVMARVESLGSTTDWPDIRHFYTYYPNGKGVIWVRSQRSSGASAFSYSFTNYFGARVADGMFKGRLGDETQGIGLDDNWWCHINSSSGSSGTQTNLCFAVYDMTAQDLSLSNNNIIWLRENSLTIQPGEWDNESMLMRFNNPELSDSSTNEDVEDLFVLDYQNPMNGTTNLTGSWNFTTMGDDDADGFSEGFDAWQIIQSGFEVKINFSTVDVNRINPVIWVYGMNDTNAIVNITNSSGTFTLVKDSDYFVGVFNDTNSSNITIFAFDLRIIEDVVILIQGTEFDSGTPSDTCTCVDGVDWDVNLADSCRLNIDCSPNLFNLTGTGTFFCNATLNHSGINNILNNQNLIIEEGCFMFQR